MLAALTVVSLLAPAAAFAGDGGAGSGGEGTGDNTSVGSLVWRYRDSYGAASNASVKTVLSEMGLATTAYEADANAAIDEAVAGANGECAARYRSRTGSPSANCRLVSVGAINGGQGYFTGHTAMIPQSEWVSKWNAVVSGKRYVYQGVEYTTAANFTNSDTSIDDLVAREAASNVAIIVVVLAQDEPKNPAMPPAAPTKAVTKGVSADSMTNTTSISTGTGVGGAKLVFTDRITPNGAKYAVGNVRVTDGSTDVTGKFAYAKSGDVLTMSWRGGALPEKHTFVWSFDVTVALPDVGKVTDVGSVKWNDEPDVGTDTHEFPTWRPSPDKAWIRYVGGRYEAVIDPSRGNAVGADGSTVLDGDEIAAAVNAPVSSNLAQAPNKLIISDDYSKADYLVDLGDISKARVYLSDASEGEVSSVADIVDSGEDVTDSFVIAADGTVVSATADADFRASLKGRVKAAQVTLLVPFAVNYANGKGAAQVREDAGKDLGEELAFCGIPSAGDAAGAKSPFLNAGSEQINNDLEETNTPGICGYVPPVEKDVLAESSQGGGQESIDGKTVEPGQRVEYTLSTRPKLPENLAATIENVTVTDSYSEFTTADKQTLEITDLGTGDVIPKSMYVTTWNDEAHTFVVDFSDTYVAEWWGAGMNPRIVVRFEATVDAGAPVEKTIDNQWTLGVNSSITPSNQVHNRPPKNDPHKVDTQKEASIVINGKTAVLGDELYYRLSLDASDLAHAAYRVQRLGMVDDYDDEHLKLDAGAVQVLDAKGVDVTAKFNVADVDGVLHVFARTADTKVPATGEMLPGDPQPGDLKVYAARKLDALKDPAIDQGLLGQTYQIVAPMTVIKVSDGCVVKNQATQITDENHQDTEIVTNPLKEINPRKDVTITVGGESADEQSLFMNHLFLYRLDSSVVPPNRAYRQVSDWSVTDDYDESHDRFTGQWAVYATATVLDAKGVVVAAKGDMLAGSSASALHNDWFSFHEKDGVFSLEATPAYLALVSANDALEQSWSLFVQMERITTGEVINGFDETFNHVSRHSNTVTTHTPDQTPSIDIEKFDVESGLVHGDRDTRDEELTLQSDETRIGFNITNTGRIALGKITLDDETVAGSGTITELEYPEGWDSLVLEPGASVTIYGTLAGVTAGDRHTDRGTTTGKPVIECIANDEDPFDGVEPKNDPTRVCYDDPVTDADEWNGMAERPTETLAITGSDFTSVAPFTAIAVVMGGAGIVAAAFMRKRRSRHSCGRHLPTHR